MRGYKAKTDHVILQAGSDEIELDGYVIGISIENLSTSPNTLIYGIDESPKIEMQPGESSRAYGGFTACDLPVYYQGKVRYKFAAASADNKGLLIITRLTSESKEL